MKKVLKYGCFGVLIFFAFTVVVSILVAVFDGDSGVDEIQAAENTTVNELDPEAEKKLAEGKRIRDSINSARKAEAINQLKDFRQETDEFDDLTFYYDKRTPVYANRNFIYPYIGRKGDTYWLRLKFQYSADDWLFINQIRIKTDNNEYEIYANFERDNSAEIWEWHDMSPSDDEIMMLRDMAISKGTMVRYIGSQYRKDRTITAREKDIIKKTLGIYENL